MSESFTISAFCAAEKISRSHLYNLWHRGLGPDFYMVGAHRRISESQRKDWHERSSVKVEGGAK
jgi:hypothetical protein